MEIYKKLLNDITTFVFDYDGVFTDGKVLLTNDDEPIRAINTKDTYALQIARKMGLNVVIITGGKSKSLELVLNRLGVTDIYMRAHNKTETLKEHLEKEGIKLENVLYMGDDIPDYQSMQGVKLPCCPLDAAEEIRTISKYISHKKGGEGCVRDVIEQVMKVKGKWMREEGFTW
jgi:3-deoxy-D-manno-octulosonate 8-phosphate phosphatase (KDO 8-P phosphatase)